MRRRTVVRRPVKVPAWAERFDLADWDDLPGGVTDSRSAAARERLARDRWREARDAWARDNGWSWVDEIKARRDARRSAASPTERSLP